MIACGGTLRTTTGRVILFVIVASSLVVLTSGSRAVDPPSSPADPFGLSNRVNRSRGPKYVPGEALVRFKPAVPKQFMQFGHAAVGAKVLRSSTLVDKLQLVRLPHDLPVEAAIQAYRRNPDVLYAEPNYVVRTLGVPNDTDFSVLWGLNNTGQNGGAVDADIDAPEAWNITTGSSNVVVAVIDSGIDYNHQDLAANMFQNTADCNTNGMDDDGNGFVDDCFGIDTINQDSDPIDDNGHGTHVAGTIGAVGNNGLGVVGVNWTIQLMACKFTNQSGVGDVGSAIACLDYVKTMKDRGVNVVATNNSWGGKFFSQALLDAIEEHRQRGILFVAAAGNDFSNNDTLPTYPANYYLPNVLAVAATTPTDDIAFFTNIGRRTVHLGAPGSEILSTTPGDTYSFLSGTSMATPHVTGVAALLGAQDLNRDWKAIRNLILTGGDDTVSLADTITGKRLNAFGAMICAGSTVLTRLRPISDTIAASVDSPTDLAVLNLNCAVPNGSLQVAVSPTGEIITLLDDGFGADQAAGDGIYSGQWTPVALGSYTISFPGGDSVDVQVLDNHTFSATSNNYRTITGTSLDLDDDSIAPVTTPFPILFGGGSFTQLFVSSNGTISFTELFSEFSNRAIPVQDIPVVTLVAPFWDDLYPMPATNQNVYWEVVGVAPNRELVIEWRDVRGFDCRSDSTATVKFQVVFFEGSSDVLFNYADATFGGTCTRQDRGASATVGIQVAPSKGALWGFGEGLFFGANDEVVGNNTAILWQLDGSAPSLNPVPTLTSISPSSALYGDLGFTLTVNGSDFVPASRVHWNGHDRVTTFVNSNQLTAVISTTDLSVFSSADVTVHNPQPGGGVSNQIRFWINNPVPTITSLSPSSIGAGGLSFRLTVNGSNFIPRSEVRWNGASRLTVYRSSSQLEAGILFSDIASSGTAQVTVFNGLPGGGTSNVALFNVDPFTTSSQAIYLSQSTEETSPPPGETLGSLSTWGRPKRFLGWNHAREQGLDYLLHFSRSRGQTALPIINPGRLGTSVSTQTIATSALAAAVPAELPAFRRRQSLAAGFLPTGVAAGDFNRDGMADWVVSNGGDSNLWLYLGRGDGTADLPVILPLAGRSPVWVESADLRANGILDVIVAEADSGTVGVLLGNGDGTFAAEVRYPLPGPPLSLLTGDFNGDGHKDILAGLLGDRKTGPVALLPGDSTGVFRKPVFQGGDLAFSVLLTFWMAVGDMDSDGDQDLAVIDLGPVKPGAFAYLNNGDGTFKQAQFISGGAAAVGRVNASVALGDLDEDGCLDVVVLDTLGVANVFLGHCDGSFQTVSQSQIFGVGDAGVGLALADINADGHLDLLSSGVVLGVHPIFGQEAGNLLSVQFGDGTGNFDFAQVYRGDPSAFALALADLNQDGSLDVVTANQDSDSTAVFLNDGSGGFGPPEGGYIGYQGSGVSNPPLLPIFSADADADGDPDLVLLERGRFHPVPEQITVLLNDGVGKFAAPVRSDGVEGTLPFGGYVVGDFRNTGRPDFLAIGSQFSSGTPFLIFAGNGGGGVFDLPSLTTPAGTQGILEVGDLNRDGKLDFVVAGNTGSTEERQRLTVFLGNGGGAFTSGQSMTFGGSQSRWPAALHAGDFNRDGSLDLLVWLFVNTVPFQENDVYRFFGNGDGTFGPAQLLFSNFNPFVLADVDQDGFSDIIEARHPSADFPDPAKPEFSIYLGQVDGTFSLTNTYAPYGGATLLLTDKHGSFAPTVGDFNGDGNIDIAAYQLASGFPIGRAFVQFLVGNGDGSFTPTFNIYEFHKRFVPQATAEVTGDGRSDLIELDGFTASFHVLPTEPASALQLRLVANPVVGATGRARVSLNVPSPTPISVLLSASDPAISLPSSMSIPAGSVTQEFDFTLGSTFDQSRPFVLQATLGSDVATVTGTQAQAGSTIGFIVHTDSFIPPLEQGQTTRDLIFNVVSIGGYRTTVNLLCTGLPAGAACNFKNSSLDIPSGGFNGTTFNISTSPDTPTGTYQVNLLASDGFLTDHDTTTLEVVIPSNRIPVADAGVDRLLDAENTSGTTVQLDGSGSFDPEGSPLTYHWTGQFPEGSGTVTGMNPAVTLFTGSNFITLIVNDGEDDSAPDTVQIDISDFGLSTSPSNVTVSRGQTASYTVTVSPQFFAFSRAVSLSCSGLPAQTSCSLSPTTVTPGANPVNATLTVSTTAPATVLGPPFRPPPGVLVYVVWLTLAGLTLGLVTGLIRRWDQERLVLRYSVSLLLILLLGQVACGGGGGASVGPSPRPGTPIGTHNITVSGTSGSLQRSTSATLTVQ